MRQENFSYQATWAQVQRTDSNSAVCTVCHISPDIGGLAVQPSLAQCVLDWPGLPVQALLPIDEINQGAAFDTARHGAQLLPTAAFGGITYRQVLRIKRAYYQNTGPAMTVFYTQSQGVVAYTEQKTGLWYRLP